MTSESAKATTESVAETGSPTSASSGMTTPKEVPATQAASLFVTDLSPETTEPNLFDLFSQAGPVLSVRICLDAHTRRSLGYAYINFQNLADAKTALENLNFTKLHGKTIRVMWVQKDATVRRSGVGNVFIRNLHPSVDPKALHDTFSVIGPVSSTKIVERIGFDTNQAFVHFESAEDAQTAIDKINGKILAGCELSLAHYTPPNKGNEFTNIFIKNLDESTNEEQFEKMFERFGKITSIVLQRDEKGVSRGFGFVNFESHSSAVAAIEAMHDTEVSEGKKLHVGRAMKRHEREVEKKLAAENRKIEAINRGVNLYVRNLDPLIDEEWLRREFSTFGTISSCRVMRDEDNKVSRGYGFVCFSSPDEATRAVTAMNNRLIGTKQISVSLAQKREDRAMIQAATMPSSRHLLSHPMSSISAHHQHHTDANAMQNPFIDPSIYYAAAARAGAGAPNPAAFYSMYRPPTMPGMTQRHPTTGFSGDQYARGPRAQRPPRTTTNGMPQSLHPQQQQQRPVRPFNKFIQRPDMQQQPMMPSLGGLSLHDHPVSNPVAGTGSTAIGQPQPQPAPVQEEQQKQMLGEQLYSQIIGMEPQWAGKITGMLLEMGQQELVHLINHRDALERKVAEARSVLQAHMSKQETSAASVQSTTSV